MKIAAVWTVGALIGMGALVGCKNDNLFGSLRSEGSGSAEDLIADGDIALAKRDFSAALDSFTRALAREPNNTDALYGAAVARMGTAGLNIGQLVTNLLNSTSSAPLYAALREASLGVQSVYTGHPDSLLYLIDLDRLEPALNDVICWLETIRAGGGSGSVNPDDGNLLVNLALVRLLRAAVVPVRRGYVDFRVSNGAYTVVDLSPPTVPDDEALQVAGDIIRAFQCARDAVLKLGLSTSSTMADIQDDVEDAYDDFVSTIQTYISPSAYSDLNGRNLDSYSPAGGWATCSSI